jgi:hypothetical protein
VLPSVQTARDVVEIITRPSLAAKHSIENLEIRELSQQPLDAGTLKPHNQLEIAP